MKKISLPPKRVEPQLQRNERNVMQMRNGSYPRLGGAIVLVPSTVNVKSEPQFRQLLPVPVSWAILKLVRVAFLDLHAKTTTKSSNCNHARSRDKILKRHAQT